MVKRIAEPNELKRLSNMAIIEFLGKYIEEKTYVLQEGKQLLMVDAVRSDELDSYLERIKPTHIWIVLTHEHIDHIYGVAHYRKQYDCDVLCSCSCGERIKNSKTNFSYYKEVLFGMRANCVVPTEIDAEYVCHADKTFQNYIHWDWEGHELSMWETPGHSPGSICVLLDGKALFTGDSLLKKDKIITRFPGGNKQEYRSRTLPLLQQFSMEIEVYPGHGESGKMSEFQEQLER